MLSLSGSVTFLSLFGIMKRRMTARVYNGGDGGGKSKVVIINIRSMMDGSSDPDVALRSRNFLVVLR